MSCPSNGSTNYLFTLWQQEKDQVKLLGVGDKSYQQYDADITIDTLLELGADQFVMLVRTAEGTSHFEGKTQTLMAMSWERPNHLRVIGLTNINDEVEYSRSDTMPEPMDERELPHTTTIERKLSYVVDTKSNKIGITVFKTDMKTKETKEERREEWKIR
jgi:hypothetical protein